MEILHYFLVNQLYNCAEINKSLAVFFLSYLGINVKINDLFIFVSNCFNSR